MNKVKNSYENGVCPDCQGDIPDNVVDGEACLNCGHVFYEEVKGLKFKCPDCGGERLECCFNGPHTAEVTTIDGEGDFDLGDYQSSADVDRFQCLVCGYVLEERYGTNFVNHNLTRQEKVVEWCKKHCEQEK